MYCKNCGREIGDAKYCPLCGTEQDTRLSDPENMFEPDHRSGGSFVAERYRYIFRDPLFLVLVILETAACIIMLCSGSIASYSSTGGNVSVNIGADIPSILFTIALWLIFAQAKKPGPGFGTAGFTIASGVVKAIWILLWIVIGIMAVALVGFAAVGGEILENLPPEIFDFDFDIDIPNALGASRTITPEMTLFIPAVIVAIIAVVLIVLIVINLLYVRKLHKFAKSVCVSLKTGMLDIKCAGAVRGWMIAGFVLECLSILTVFSGRINALIVIAQICSAAATLIAAILIKRHFIKDSYMY